MVNRALDRAATRVTHHEHKFRAGNCASEFHAPGEVGIGDGAGDAGVEKVAEAGVENNFRRRPRINAAQNDGVRILTGGGRLLVVKHVARFGFSGSKALVAALEVLQHLRWR